MRAYWRFVRANPRFIAFGFLMAFISSAGQTYFIGVFGPEIQAEFDLNNSEWGRIYMIGTLMSAALITWSGGLIDRFQLHGFTFVTLLGLAGACLVMSLTPFGSMLILSVFLLRHFGQGLSSHINVTSMARYFSDDRGKALALTVTGFAAGEAILPVSANLAIGIWGWRATYLGTAVLVLLGAGLALFLLRGHHERHQRFQSKQEEAGLPSDGIYTRRRMLSEARFYLMLPALVAPSLIITALFFFPAEMAKAKGWSPLWVSGNYWMYSLVSAACAVLSGSLIDRFSARRLMPFFLVPMILALLMLLPRGYDWTVWLYMGFLGLTAGIYYTGRSALWAELYGVHNLGAVKAVSNAINVFSSALGPALVGGGLEFGLSFERICLIMVVASVLASGLLYLALRLPKLDQPRRE